VTKDQRTQLCETALFKHGNTYWESQQTIIAVMLTDEKIEKCVVDSKRKSQRLPFLLTDNCVGSNS
jgi:hypothetical protein